jgi:hypothetical protein
MTNNIVVDNNIIGNKLDINLCNVRNLSASTVILSDLVVYNDITCLSNVNIEGFSLQKIPILFFCNINNNITLNQNDKLPLNIIYDTYDGWNLSSELYSVKFEGYYEIDYNFNNSIIIEINAVAILNPHIYYLNVNDEIVIRNRDDNSLYNSGLFKIKIL